MEETSSGLTMPKAMTFVQVMRGCAACQTPHPSVMGASDLTVCPGCGAPSSAASDPVPVDFALSGFRGAYFNFLLWCIGKLALILHRIERL